MIYKKNTKMSQSIDGNVNESRQNELEEMLLVAPENVGDAQQLLRQHKFCEDDITLVVNIVLAQRDDDLSE